MEAVTVEALTTVAGLALVTGMIVFVIRKAGNLSGEVMDRFGALISVVVAIVLAFAARLALGLGENADLLQAALNGLVAGLAASGGYDVLNGGSKLSRDSRTAAPVVIVRLPSASDVPGLRTTRGTRPPRTHSDNPPKE